MTHLTHEAHMNNQLEEATLPAGSKIRVGPPADKPQEAIDALIALFSTKDNVLSAGLGLMEVIYPDKTSEFTYTIGIKCSSDEASTIRQALEVLQTVPTGRWPITVIPARSQFFAQDVPLFFDQKAASRGWFVRLLHFDLNSLWSKRKTLAKRPTSEASHVAADGPPPNQDLDEAIRRVVSNPSQSTREILFGTLLKCHLFVGIQDLPESISSFPVTLQNDTVCPMATSINSAGEEVLLVFTSEAAVRARNPSLGFLEMSAQAVMRMVVHNSIFGMVIINPDGTSVELPLHEVENILAGTEQRE